MTESELVPATDRDLLLAFTSRRDAAAFALLVGRYGSFVYGVCRRVLGNDPDADDAFQATFLVLARKAGGIGRPEQLGGWLHTVAVRCSRRARSVRESRRGKERPMPDIPAPRPDPDLADVRPVLDEEIAALPEKLRAALVLCELRGLDREAAALALGVPEGTLSSRLARGKEALRRRLVRRGVTLSAAGVGLALAGAAQAEVPPGLAEATAAVAVGGAGSAVVSLANAEVSAMYWTKVLKIGLATAALAVAGVGSAVVYQQAVVAEDKKAAGDKKPENDKLEGEWIVTGAMKNGQGPADKDEVIGQKLTFTADRMKFGPFEAEWKNDASKSPRQIDCTILEGPENEKGKVAQGVYKLDGDKLTLHLSHPGSERPADFESKAGANCILLMLERVKK
jgi:RNA polymerase sigma factor (sigma-70 family)